jgi:hypothetical protein
MAHSVVKRSLPSWVIVVSALACLALVVASFLAAIFYLNWGRYGTGDVAVKDVLERVSFPGGDIVVWNNTVSHRDKWIVSVGIEAKITSEDSLADYIGSRTHALNVLLEDTNSSFDAIVTFKEPLTPEKFLRWINTSVADFHSYASLWTDKNSGAHTSGVSYTNNVTFIENLNDTKPFSNFDGVIAVECVMDPRQAKSIQSDLRVLLVDPYEDEQMLQIQRQYESAGFPVWITRDLLNEMWMQYATLRGYN